MISSNKLKEKQEEVQTLIESRKLQEEQAAQELTAEEIKNYSAEVSLENNAFDMVAAYTYTEYFRDFGTASVTLEGNKVVLNYAADGLVAYYYDLNGEKVVDSAKKMPYAGVKPVEVHFQNLYRVFSASGEKFVVSYEKLQEIFGNTLHFHQDDTDGKYYITAEYKNCRISVETDEKGNIVSQTAWNRLEPLKRGKEAFEEEIDGEVQGYVQDAVTGKGMKATLKVREGGKKAGTPVKELTSNTDGSYSYGGKKGRYTVEVSAQGYITEYYEIEVIKDQIITGENMVISPEVQEGEIRIVLTWGSSPTDLDSYAIGQSSDGRRFSINFQNKSESGIGNLDVDDTSSYGPETITITDTGAEFKYSVVDYLGEGTLGGSEATVKVYLPGASSAMEFKVPAGTGVRWLVFEYKNGEIRSINQVDDQVSQGVLKE